MATMKQMENADLVLRAQVGGWLVEKNRLGPSGHKLTAGSRDVLLREHWLAAKPQGFRVLHLREGEVING